MPRLQIGNVFIGVQPVLGVEGDPMRLLFERDLTPHPQYAAFYKWLQVGLSPLLPGFKKEGRLLDCPVVQIVGRMEGYAPEWKMASWGWEPGSG